MTSDRLALNEGLARHARTHAKSDASGLLTVAELASFLGVSADWVYAHADELGAWRLGAGPKARLRFDLEEVQRRLTACEADRESVAPSVRVVERRSARRRPTGFGNGGELLPIRRVQGAR